MTKLGGVVAATLVLLATIAGCGFNAQTLQPYTPADGVEFSIGQPNSGPVLKVRNLLIVAKPDGTGFLSGSMFVTEGTDELVGVKGQALQSDGTDAGALTVGAFTPLEIGSHALTVLVDQPAITISQANMKAGLTVELTLSFATAGDYTLRVPVIAADNPVWATVSPSAQATSES